MAELAEALVTRMADHGLGGLVGSRFYNLKAPQSPTYPCVVFEEVTAVRRHAMGADAGVIEAPIRFTSYATTLLEARSVDAQVRACFQRYSGTSALVVIQDSIVDGSEPDYDHDVNVFSVTTDITFWYVGT